MEKVFSFKHIDNPEFCEDYAKLKLVVLEESGLLDHLQAVSLRLLFYKQVNEGEGEGFTVEGVLAKADGSIIKCQGNSHKMLDSINSMVENLKIQIKKISENKALEYNRDSFYPYYYSEYY
ncbi:MAG: hypothetical protein AB8G05_19905 [Oligoflexales bacterium]